MADYEQNPGTLNFAFTKGDTMSVPLTISSRWETYSWRATIRPGYGETPATTITTGSLTYTTAGDTTALTLSLTSSSMSALGVGRFVWDLQWSSAGVVRTFLLGDFTVRDEVTS